MYNMTSYQKSRKSGSVNRVFTLRRILSDLILIRFETTEPYASLKSVGVAPTRTRTKRWV